MNCHRNQKQIGQNNHLQTLFDTHSYVLYNWKGVHQNPLTSKHYITLSKPNQAKSVREKKGWASFEQSFQWKWSTVCIISCFSKIFGEIVPPPPKKPDSLIIHRLQCDERSFQCLWYPTQTNMGSGWKRNLNELKWRFLYLRSNYHLLKIHNCSFSESKTKNDWINTFIFFHNYDLTLTYMIYLQGTSQQHSRHTRYIVWWPKHC